MINRFLGLSILGLCLAGQTPNAFAQFYAATGPPAGLDASEWQHVAAEVGRDGASPDALLGGADSGWLAFGKLFAPEPQDDAQFGMAVATDGAWLAVGAPYYDNNNPEGMNGFAFPDAGKVYLYERVRQGWALRYSITGDQALGNFGYSVALIGDDLIVGAPFHDLENLPDIGLVSFYRRQGDVWILNNTFACCFAGAASGLSVALSANRFDTFAYIGSPLARSSQAGPVTGLAFVFRKNDSGGWDYEVLPTPNDLAAGDLYGFAVAGTGGEMLVGAPNQDVDGVGNSGGAYVFGRSLGGDWSQEQKLSFFDTTLNDYFGYSVAIDHDWAVVGAPGRSVDGHPATDTGAVQVFHYTTQYGWFTWQELTGENAASGDVFGASVTLDEAELGVGSRSDDNALGDNTGSVYFFHNASSGFPPEPDWQQTGKFFNASSAAVDAFGYSVALAGEVAVVGAPGDDTDALPDFSEAGSVRTFLTDRIFANGFDL